MFALKSLAFYKRKTTDFSRYGMSQIDRNGLEQHRIVYTACRANKR